MAKIIVKGWQEEDLEAEEMHVHLETEGYVWFVFVLKDGQKLCSRRLTGPKIETGLLKETVQ